MAFTTTLSLSDLQSPNTYLNYLYSALSLLPDQQSKEMTHPILYFYLIIGWKQENRSEDKFQN